MAAGKEPLVARPPVASPKDSDRRKARDADLRTQDEMIARHLEEARRSGELEQAQGFGKSLPGADGWDETPAELRMPFKILKDAGVPPPEVEMFHRRAALLAEIAGCPSEAEREALKRRLVDLELAIALRLEGLRATGKL